MTKLATAVVLLAAVVCLGSTRPTVSSVFTDIFEFDKGFVSGFVNQDVTRSPECVLILEKSKSQLDKVWGDFQQFKNETLRDEAFRDILHVVQKLPKEFEGCKEVASVVEHLARKTIILIDPEDFTKRASKNILYKGLEIFGKLQDAGSAQKQGDFFKAGYELGRAFDLLID